MAVQFIKGTGICDHERILLEQANEWLAKSSEHEVYFLVPNYIKFEKEMSLIRRASSLKGVEQKETVASLKLQVFSFERLAWFLLDEEQLSGQARVNEAGMAMLFRKILQEKKDELHLFRGELTKAGFIAQLMDLFEEFSSGKITKEDLRKFLAENSGDEEMVNRKFKEILVIFEGYQEALLRYDLRLKKPIELLTGELSKKKLDNVMIIVYGYTNFSAVERALIEQFMLSASEFRLSIVTESVSVTTQLNPLELFYDAKSLYQSLYKQAREWNLPILSDRQAPIIKKNQAIDTAWRNLTDNQRLPKLALKDNIQLWKSENPVSEIHQVAKEIHRLVVEENYRYKDIQILTRDLENYHTHIAPIFSWTNIPFTMDRVDAMKNHSLVEFLQSLFAIDKYYFKYEDVLRLLRSELFVPFFKEEETEVGKSLDLFAEPIETTLDSWRQKMEVFREEVDITENIVLQYGYEKGDWTRARDWKFVLYDFQGDDIQENRDVLKEQTSNEIRRFVGQTISEFFKELKQAKTSIEAIELFYRFLVENGVEEQMRFLRDDIATSDLAKARDYEQVWSALMEILDDYVQIFGDDPFDIDTFSEIFTTGLETYKYGKLPATIDNVQITSMELARTNQAKIVFAIGLTNHTLPKAYENKSLLTQEERDSLSTHLENGKYFLNDVRKRSAKESYLAYNLFLSASEKLYLSYPENLENVKDNRMSPFVARFSDYLSIPEQKRYEVSLTDDSKKSLSQVSTYRILIRDLIALKQQEADEKPAVLWNLLMRELEKSEAQPLFAKVKEGLTHQNIPQPLSEESVAELYGNEIQASVSRFELFHQCEFKHFASYGLSLKERQYLDLSPAASGNFFHESMDVFFKLLRENQLTLKELNQDQVERFSEEVLQIVTGLAQFDLLSRDSRMRYLKTQLGGVVRRVIWAIRRQADYSGLSTEATELIFGQIAGQKGIPGLKFELESGKSLQLRGKIDRIDSFEEEGVKYLGIVDYKSGDKKFSLADNYYGLAMQMVTYLDVAITNATREFDTKPIGSLYFHLQNPEIKAEGLKDIDLTQEILKEFKYKGFLVNDEKVLEKLDNNFEKNSLVYPLKRGKSDEVSVSGTAFNEDELGLIMSHNRQKFHTAASEIYSGKVKLNPIREGNHPRACAYCPFKSVCLFDPMLKENKYKKMEKFGVLKVQKNNILSQMEQELGGESHE